MIRPHMDYIDHVIDSSSAERIGKLDKLQNKAVRRIESYVDQNKRKSIDELHTMYNIEKLAVRRKNKLLKKMYRQSKDVNNIDYDWPVVVNQR